MKRTVWTFLGRGEAKSKLKIILKPRLEKFENVVTLQKLIMIISLLLIKSCTELQIVNVFDDFTYQFQSLSLFIVNIISKYKNCDNKFKNVYFLDKAFSFSFKYGWEKISFIFPLFHFVFENSNLLSVLLTDISKNCEYAISFSLIFKDSKEIPEDCDCILQTSVFDLFESINFQPLYLTINYLNDAIVKLFAEKPKTFKNCRKLKMKPYHHINSRYFSKIIGLFPNLKSMTIPNYEAIRDKPKLPNLNEIEYGEDSIDDYFEFFNR